MNEQKEPITEMCYTCGKFEFEDICGSGICSLTADVTEGYNYCPDYGQCPELEGAE